ncbi:MAG: 23S rRNA (adenine(2503)-C(2))-methyltransferase RlmN [bacterium]|nr:23S rRNA (adenine(2503)-C(2))-methyltransferase RlmN [bacterium]
MLSILGIKDEELKDIVIKEGYEPYRAQQILDWIYDKAIPDFYSMSNLPKELRNFLSDNFSVLPFEPLSYIRDEDTVKFLFKTKDDLTFESVLIFHHNRVTVCLSSQIGCPIRCKFCATGDSFHRNLTYEEIIGQYIFAKGYIRRDIRGIVFMGMGEPFLNEENVYKTIDTLISKIKISPRHITISTSGIPQGIENLSLRKPNVRLAFSIWTPDEEKRKLLVPLANKYKLDDILKSLRKYVSVTGNRISVEYTLLKGINDSLNDAYKLVKLFSDIPVFFNVILYNPKDRPTEIYRTSIEEAQRFVDLLKSLGKEAYLRISKGLKISGACGQLRSTYERVE